MTRHHRGTAFRPRLESLDDRACPSCLVELVGSTLTVTGDAADNEIRILYFAPGELSVECDGTPTQIDEPVTKVVVRAGAGDDYVYAELYPEGLDVSFPGTWTVDLGAGNDQSDFHLLSFLGIDVPLSVNVSGANGDDAMFTELIGFTSTRYDQTVDGGNGNDSIFNFYSGGNLDAFVSRTRGGNGDDRILEELTLWRVQGRFDGHADGGNGSDFLDSRLGEYILFDPTLPLFVIGFDVAPGERADYQLTGGNGHDALIAKYVGRMDGQLNILANGGNGDDEVFAYFDVNVESTGQFSADIRGDNGDDSMEVQVRFFETELVEIPDLPGFFVDGLAGYSDTPAPLSDLSVRADGGHGLDTCLHSAGITLLGIEDDQPI